MAESKRTAATTNKVATPKPAGGGSAAVGASTQAMQDNLQALLTSIGAQLKVTLSGPISTTLEGTLFTYDPTLAILALNTRQSPSQATTPSAGPGDYTIIPVSRISNFQILSLATNKADSFSAAHPPISKVDTAKLRAREEARVRKLQEEEGKKGKGVTAEGQQLFNALDRMYKCRWHNTDIIVDDSVIVSAPYEADNCKAPKDKQQVLVHIKKVVEGERRKIAERARGGGGSGGGPPLKGG